MKKIKYIARIFLASLITLSFLGCGGGGGVYNPPLINIANDSISKTEFLLNDETIEFKYFFNSKKDFENKKFLLKQRNKYVKFSEHSDYPETTLSCTNGDGKTLWETKYTYPHNFINGVYVQLNDFSSEIFVLWGGGIEQHIRIIDEFGRIKSEFPLEGTKKFDSFFTVTYSRQSIVAFDGKKYIFAETGEGIGIFSTQGKLLKFINLPRYPYGHYAKELKSANGDRYLVLTVDQQPTSHSSTLIILSRDLDVVYEEFLLGLDWIGFSKLNNSTFYILTENQWKPKKVWVTIPNRWKYIINN